MRLPLRRGHRSLLEAPALAVAGLCMVTASAPADQWHGLNAGAPVYNGAIEFTEVKAAAIEATGCRAIRLNFRLDYPTRISWNASMLALYDQFVERALSHNLTVLGLLCNECVLQGQEQWNAPPDANGMNAYVGTFSDTALLLIDRYKDRIKRWEIWNEPNCWSNPSYASDPQHAGCTYILPAVYANLLAETYKKCNYYDGRRILTDNGISLCSGGLLAHDINGSFATAMDYMQQVYNRTAVWNWMKNNTGRRYPWDYFGYHFYLAGGSAITKSKLDSYFNNVRTNQSANQDTSPVLLTEFGWNTASLSEALQRDNMRLAYDHMETKSYIAGTYWYQWVDEGYPNLWGITRLNGLLKPAYDEFRAQNNTAPPTPPQVTIAANLMQIPHGQPVQLTPTVIVEPGIILAESVWRLGAQTLIEYGPPSPLAHTFPMIGQYQVYLTVRDGQGLVGTSNTLFLEVIPPPAKLPDLDLDGDVDQEDFGLFQLCMTGPGIPQMDPACAASRLDLDGDVDLDDFAILQNCFTGPGVAVDPDCVNR